jgi:phosphinothricin acetyltransferase
MRRKGLGRILLGGLIDSARSRDFHKLILNVFDTNEPAKQLYLALGFRHVGTYEKQGIMDGQYVDVTIMEKLLAEK